MPSSITGGSVDILQGHSTLTDAEIKVLPTSAVNLLAAPGAGRFILPFYAVARLVWVADYGNIHANALLNFRIGSSDVLLNFAQNVQSNVSGLLAGGGPDGTIGWTPARFLGAVAAAPGNLASSGIAQFYDSDLVNQPLTLSANNQGAGDFSDGDAGNSLRVTVLYCIIDI